MKTVMMAGSTGRLGSQLVPRLVTGERVAPRALDVAGIPVLIAPVCVTAGSAGRTPGAISPTGAETAVRVFAFLPNSPAHSSARPSAAMQVASLRYVGMRPPFFQRHLFLTAAVGMAAAGGLFFEAGDASIGMLDPRDLVPAREPRMIWGGDADRGPEPASHAFSGVHDIADCLATILERPVQPVAIPHERMELWLGALGAGGWYARLIRELYTVYRNAEQGGCRACLSGRECSLHSGRVMRRWNEQAGPLAGEPTNFP